MAKDLPEGAPVMLRMSVERESGYLSWLGVQMDDVEYGAARLSVPFDDKLTDQEAAEAVVHNGITTTLMEQAGELAVRTTLDDPVNDPVEPLNLDTTFLADAAHDVTVHAEAVERRAESTVVTITAESKTPSGDRETVARGQGIYRLAD
ncbi:MAG: PaaI family thioesterase [Halorientalis sp.]